MNWIKKLLKRFSKKSTSQINWQVAPNGTTYFKAMEMCGQGWKVRSVQWPKADYVDCKDGIFYRHHKYSNGAAFSVYNPTDADRHGGCQWQIVGER